MRLAAAHGLREQEDRRTRTRTAQVPERAILSYNLGKFLIQPQFDTSAQFTGNLFYGTQNPDPGGPVGGFADLPAVYDVMARSGDGAKQIWVTEFGAATGSQTEAMSETDQAESLRQARELAQSWPWVGPVIIYELRDAGSGGSDLEQSFGVLREDLSPKDAGRALMG